MMLVIALVIFVASTDAASLGGVTCDFESDLCGYTFDTSAEFNWTHSNSTPSDYTGPSYDHTTGNNLDDINGWYAYLETSWPRIGGEKARLRTPEISSSTNANCLEFYFHMYGDHVNTLHVYMSTNNSNPIWTMERDQGDSWIKAQVPLNVPSQNFQIVFEGIVGSSYRGDIAIDDVRTVYNSTCRLLPITADPLLHMPGPPAAAPPLPVQSFCGYKQSSRIINGNFTSPGDWPWQAMLLQETSDGSWEQFCGGSLIYSQWVLTAAHCVVDNLPFERIRVRMGAYYIDVNRTVSSEQDFDVTQIVYHPTYNFGATYNNDLALLRLDRDVQPNFRVNYVCIPTSGDQFTSGDVCSLTGWGDLEQGGDNAEVLMKVEVPIVSNDVCTAPDSYDSFAITPKMRCAGYKEGGKDTCQGDSGGPLSCYDGSKWHIDGVTSWGYGCAMADYYGVYARVGTMRDWIAKVVTV